MLTVLRPGGNLPGGNSSFLLWLGWYLSGPLFETLDYWDAPQEEVRDIMPSAGLGNPGRGCVLLCAGPVPDVARQLRIPSRSYSTTLPNL